MTGTIAGTNGTIIKSPGHILIVPFNNVFDDQLLGEYYCGLHYNSGYRNVSKTIYWEKSGSTPNSSPVPTTYNPNSSPVPTTHNPNSAKTIYKSINYLFL